MDSCTDLFYRIIEWPPLQRRYPRCIRHKRRLLSWQDFCPGIGGHQNSDTWQEGTIFGAEMPITGAQAAVLLQNALQLPTATVSAEDSYPEWAAAAMATMAQNGISLSENAMTRGRTAIALYRVSQLAATAPGTAVFFRD